MDLVIFRAMFLGLVFLIGVSQAAPVILDKVNCSAGYYTILGYPKPFSIPLTPLADNISCKYTVSFWVSGTNSKSV